MRCGTGCGACGPPSQGSLRAAPEPPPGLLGAPARSWLRGSPYASRGTGNEKRGPVPIDAANGMRLGSLLWCIFDARSLRYLSACGAPRGARVPKGTSHKDFASSRRAIPLIEGEAPSGGSSLTGLARASRRDDDSCRASASRPRRRGRLQRPFLPLSVLSLLATLSFSAAFSPTGWWCFFRGP